MVSAVPGGRFHFVFQEEPVFRDFSSPRPTMVHLCGLLGSSGASISSRAPLTPPSGEAVSPAAERQFVALDDVVIAIVDPQRFG